MIDFSVDERAFNSRNNPYYNDKGYKITKRNAIDSREGSPLRWQNSTGPYSGES